jgi:hypothetical protein
LSEVIVVFDADMQARPHFFLKVRSGSVLAHGNAMQLALHLHR